MKPFRLFGLEFRITILSKHDSTFGGSSTNDIISLTAFQNGLTPEDLLGNRRIAHIKNARFEAMYLIRKRTNLSYPMIGKLFNKHYTTVIHGVKMWAQENNL